MNLVIDVGCSFTKLAVVDGEHRVECYRYPTYSNPEDLISGLEVAVRHVLYAFPVKRAMVISYSDSVFYETEEGDIKHVAPMDLDEHAFGIPAYEVAGKPTNSPLVGMASALFVLGSRVKWFLPPATFIASRLIGDVSWTTWDLTHASNSGMWDYGQGRWCPEMDPFLERCCVNEHVVKPEFVMDSGMGVDWLIGGHDSVFLNANDVVFSTKPYLSVGTWITASVESEFAPSSPVSPVRYVIAPNGTTLAQLCLMGQADYKERTIVRLCKCQEFFEERGVSGPVEVFGVWAEQAVDALSKRKHGIEFVVGDAGDEVLHVRASRYMEGAT